MSQVSEYLLSRQPRARWVRLDTAQLLKRFFFCERALLVSQAAWIPAIAPLEIKTGLARFIWQNAETAHALRNRVFELRFPSRLLDEEGADHALIDLFSGVKDSPSVPAFLLSVGKVLLPALRNSYRAYLHESDSIADGPTHRFLFLALAEKVEQISAFEPWAEFALSGNPELREYALAWTQAVADRLSHLGGVGVGPCPSSAGEQALPGSKSYAIPHRPARDPRFWPCRFYWPDIIDPNYPYGEGMQLQLRSAISHLNEVWLADWRPARAWGTRLISRCCSGTLWQRLRQRRWRMLAGPRFPKPRLRMAEYQVTPVNTVTRVFILGAGASRFAGYPLSLDLWPFIRDSFRAEASAIQRADHVTRAMNQVLKANPPRDFGRSNLEELFTLLDLADMGTEPVALRDIGWRDVRPKLMGMISDAFTWKQCQFQSEASTSQRIALGNCTDFLAATDTIISFNWDILREAALSR